LKVLIANSFEAFFRFFKLKKAVLSKLKSDKVIYLSDKSDPDEIREIMQMSKKTFKQAIGKLYKAKLITLTENSIELID
jgi:hypothetical protein